MKHFFTAFAILGAISIMIPSGIRAQELPRTVVESFVKMELNGQLLTADGRSQAMALFSYSRPFVSQENVTVIGEDYSIREIWVRGNHAEVLVTYKVLGNIDSSSRYSAPNTPSMTGVARYDLILKKAERADAGDGGRQWQIQSPQRSIRIGLNAAIANVKATRDKVTASEIKRNAGITLMQLRKFQG